MGHEKVGHHRYELGRVRVVESVVALQRWLYRTYHDSLGPVRRRLVFQPREEYNPARKAPPTIMPDDPEFDRRMMRRCIDLAASAAESGNTAVGCLITLDGRIVAEAEEQSPNGSDPFAHAEILAVVAALKAVGRPDLPKAILYTTNEPCFLCSYAIREARIGRVVFSVETPGVGGATSDYPILKASQIERWGPPPRIETGLLAGEYRSLRKRKRAQET